MVLNATFNNSSVKCISWRSALMVEERVENHQPAASHWQTLSHNVVLNTPRLELEIRTHNVSGDRHWSIKADRHDIHLTELLLKVALSTIALSFNCYLLNICFIEMLDKFIIYIVRWYMTLYVISNVALDNRINTRHCQDS
jgi:hypothetical protein